MKKHLLFIVNPNSGKVKIKDSLLEICHIFCQSGYELTLNVTQYISDAMKEAKNHEPAYDLIVCCGGDGTFNSMASEIITFENPPSIGYIPSGSTNDFGRSIGLTGSSVDITRKIMSGLPRNLDIGSFNQYYFSYIASFGAFTETSYNTPQSLKNRLGHLAYILEGVKDLSAIEPCHMKITYGNQTLDDNYIWGAVCNSTSIGGVIRLNKDLVDYNDGLFEVILIKAPKALFDLTKIIVSINTQEYSPDVIDFFQTDEVSFYPDTEIPWSLDGEYAKGSHEIHIKNIHNALQILV